MKRVQPLIPNGIAVEISGNKSNPIIKIEAKEVLRWLRSLADSAGLKGPIAGLQFQFPMDDGTIMTIHSTPTIALMVVQE